MKKFTQKIAILILISLTPFISIYGQAVKPEKVTTAIYHDVIGPIKNLPALTVAELEAEKYTKKVVRNEELKERQYPFASNALPKGPDPVWQKEMGTTVNPNRDLVNVFSGQNSFSDPPDDNGTVGPNHYMQTINVKYTIYDKSGNLLAGPTNLNTLFEGVPGANRNDGDPIVLFDEQIGRFFVAEFSGIGGAPDYMLIAISQTDDPTGMWDRWSFPMTGFPDYMKFGVWRDAYYMGTNTYSGNDIYAFERDVMIAGGESPQLVQFNNPWRPNSGFHCVLPVDNDGEFAPEGTPGLFMTINDDAWGGSAQDQIWIYELDVDWDNPNNSTFNRVQQIIVEPFDSNFGPSWDNIKQPGTSQELDAINQILMHRVQYRNFDGSQHIVCQHTVDVDGTDHAGIRWYELEYADSEWGIRQSSTYAPDDDSRWMGSIAMNSNHEIALAYSVSSSSTYPSIRYTGQSAAENAISSGILNVEEVSIHEGSASQTSSNRWGDYSNISLDPNDDLTFWFTSQYNISGQQRGTKIAAFSVTSVPLAEFSAVDTIVPTGQETTFIDESYGSPTEWLWNFEGGSPPTSTDQNPENIIYNADGAYDVQLIAINDNGSDTILKEDFITVSSSVLPVVDFMVNKKGICLNDTALFTDLSLFSPIQWEWEFNPATITFINGTSSESQNPEVIFNNPGVYDVTLTATNMNGESSSTQNEMVHAGGYMLEFFETFENDGLLFHEWTIENPDDDITWEVFEIGGTSPGNTAMGINFTAYQAIGERDRLVSPPLNLTGITNASLSFQHAYAKRLEEASDSLIIYISTDCGESWSRIFEGGEDGSGNFATHELTEDFWPETASDWCISGWGATCITLSLNEYIGNTDIRIAFETYSFYGNPMFIDNIAVSPTVGIYDDLTNGEIHIFPNPNNGIFTIQLTDKHTFDQLEMINPEGEIILKKNLSSDVKSFTINESVRLSKGIYLLRFNSIDSHIVKKIIVK